MGKSLANVVQYNVNVGMLMLSKMLVQLCWCLLFFLVEMVPLWREKLFTSQHISVLKKRKNGDAFLPTRALSSAPGAFSGFLSKIFKCSVEGGETISHFGKRRRRE